MNRLVLAVLHVAVYHDPPGFPSINTSVFLGKVRIPLSDIDVNNGLAAWYLLQPESPGFCSLRDKNVDESNGMKNEKYNEYNNGQGCGSLRVRISYSADHVFPFKVYEQLCSLLMESSNTKVQFQVSTKCVFLEAPSSQIL
jgi:Ras GTPase-activating protein 3